MCRPFIGGSLQFDGSSVSIAEPSWPCTGWLLIANLQLPCMKLEKVERWSRETGANFRETNAKIRKRARNQNLFNWMSCFSNFLTTLLCFISRGWNRKVHHCIAWHFGDYHAWIACMNQSWTPWMEADDIHDTAALLGHKHLSIMHPHEKTWKRPYTLRGFLAYMSVICVHGIQYVPSIYCMTMPIPDLRWHTRISSTFFGGHRKRAEKIELSRNKVVNIFLYQMKVN